MALCDCSKEMIARLKVTGPSRSTTSFGLTCFPTSYSHLLFIPGSRGLADMPEPFWNEVRKLLFSDCETKQDWSLVAVMAPNPNTATLTKVKASRNRKILMMSFSSMFWRTMSSMGRCIDWHMPTSSAALFSAFFTAELFTFHSGLGPKTHVENTNAYLGQDDCEKLPEK